MRAFCFPHHHHHHHHISPSCAARVKEKTTRARHACEGGGGGTHGPWRWDARTVAVGRTDRGAGSKRQYFKTNRCDDSTLNWHNVCLCVGVYVVGHNTECVQFSH